MTLPKPTDPRYNEQHSYPKWAIRPTVLCEHRLFPRIFPELTKADHEKLALERAIAAGKAKEAYVKAVVDAAARFGHPPINEVVSGIYNENFPEPVKDRLRALVRKMTALQDQAQAHYKATGKRKDFVDTDLGAIALRTRNSHYMGITPAEAAACAQALARVQK